MSYLLQKLLLCSLIMVFLVFNIIPQNASADGKVGLDRTVYPLPSEERDLVVTIQILDIDFDISPHGVDVISENNECGIGPVKISVKRGGNEVVLGYGGGESSKKGKIDSSPLANNCEELQEIRQFGPIKETSPDSGIFEFDISLKNTDGPESSSCPKREDFAGLGENNGLAQVRFDDTIGAARHCILQGDVLKVEYTDPSDLSGNIRTVSTSARFGLQDPKFSSSTNVFRIGHDFTLIVADPDLNLNSDEVESYPLDLITFKSDKIRINLAEKEAREAFDPNPSVLRETGDNTGIFYTILEMPRMIKGQVINLGEKIEFEYRDRGTVASGFVGENVEDFTLEGYISNRGGTVAIPKNEQTPGKGITIPLWVKTSAMYWVDETVPKHSINAGIEFLLNSRIIYLSDENVRYSVSYVPSWVKLSSLLWANGTVSDQEFLDAIKFLIKKNIIKVELQ